MESLNSSEGLTDESLISVRVANDVLPGRVNHIHSSEESNEGGGIQLHTTTSSEYLTKQEFEERTNSNSSSTSSPRQEKEVRKQLDRSRDLALQEEDNAVLLFKVMID